MSDQGHPGQGGAPEYGQPQYGQPQYGRPQFGRQPQHPGVGAVPAGAPAGGGGGRKAQWITLAVVLAAALGVGGYVLFAGSDAKADTPTSAVRTLLEAGRTNDVGAAKKVLCARDLKAGVVGALLSGGRVTSYTIGTETRNGDRATVATTVSTSGSSKPDRTPVPVVRENGSWKVCVSLLDESGSGSGSAAPSLSASVPPASASQGVPPVSVPSIGLPSGALGGVNPCGYASSLGEAATVYVSAAELGQTDLAQGCVDGDSVPRSVTAGLRAAASNDYYNPSPAVSGDTAVFTSLGGKKLAVTLRAGSGGYRVVKVERG